MSQKKLTDKERQEAIIADARKGKQERDQTYREQALKLFPWVCGKCEREFSGKKLRELTVHHRDHDHDNNPPDGSNWELLCIYCHDNEHSRYLDAEGIGEISPDDGSDSSSTFTDNPFAGLDELLKKTKK